MQTIPNSVLAKIREHRPHLGQLIDNLKKFPAQAAQIENAIADDYLLGETRLSGAETCQLANCCTGGGYGGAVPISEKWRG